MSKVKTNIKKALVTVSALLLGFGVTASSIMNDNFETITAFFGQQSFKVEQGELPEGYDLEHGYKSQFKSVKELVANGFKVQEEEQKEGTVLLKNDNALPLKKGSKVSVFGVTSAAPFYGASGSGGINTTEAIGWYDAFAGKYHDETHLKNTDMAQGDVLLEVNPELKDEYTAWSKNNAYKASSSTTNVKIGDVPWDVVQAGEGYAQIPTYGEAGIFIIKRTGGEGYDLPATSGKNAQYGNENYAKPSVNDGVDGDYLQLSASEISVLEGLKAMKAEGKIKKIVLILNMASTIQLDFLKNDTYDIDACLWTGSVGEVGTVAVAKLLTGEYNFSAGAASTLWANHLMNPINNNFTDQNYFFTYENYADFGFINPAEDNQYQSTMSTYMVYQEGMYMGYKYTETRYEDYVMGTKNVGEYDYDATVAYPFGYGLSYTNFEFSAPTVQKVGQKYEVSVEVTNTGKVAGKTPVQIYIAKPYAEYAKENQIQVPSVELIDFGKTSELAAGAKETVTVEVQEKYFTSYDAFGAGTYVIMPGDYYLIPAMNAHEATNHLLAAKGYTKANTNGKMDADGNAAMAHRITYSALDKETYSLSETTGNPIRNIFTFADINTYEGRGTNSVEYYSRENWNAIKMSERKEDGTLVKYYAELTMTQTMANELRDQMDASKVIKKGGEYPTYGAQNGLVVVDMKGVAYENLLWDQLLDQMTWDEQVDLLSNGRHRTQAVESIAKPSTGDENGPNGLSQTYSTKGGGSRFSGPTNPYGERVNDPDIKRSGDPRDKVTYTTTGFSSNGVLAATFNREIAAKVGKQIGEEGYWAGMSGLLGGGFNILRSPYAGRTAEYYSEDAMLTGLIGAPETAAIESMGVHCFVKHCALNESETGRHGVQTWVTEQALRENYLRAFELVFEDGGAYNVMTTFSRFGTIAGANSTALGKDWLRGEIGMPGIVETDCAGDMTDGKHGEAYVSRIVNVYTGATDLNEYNYGADDPDYTGGTYTFKHFAPVEAGGTGEYGNMGQAMREACKRIIYATVNSNAICGYSSSTKVIRVTPPWQDMMNKALMGATVFFGLSVAFCVIDGLVGLARKKK
ncbi:MAG: glycoside hydrolase family 3 C-terminal domain-containing protein [Clostridia bacterium]|nr:glycoside hydrolase family 3 C-terminal domain-containing protein [Clostridia bacterium]